MNEIVVDPVAPTNDNTTHRQFTKWAISWREIRTHLKIIYEICDRKATSNDCCRQYRVLQGRHIARAVLVFDIFNLVAHHIKIEDLIETVPARLNLQRVRKEDKNCNGQLPNGYEQRARRIHLDYVCGDLQGNVA